MDPLDFACTLYMALEDPDEEIAGLARRVRAAIERGDVHCARADVAALSARMRQLRLTCQS